MKKVIFVRHGETEWNAEQRFHGQADVPLSEKGVKQAQNLGNILKNYEVNSIYSSNLTRAINTAQIIANILKLEAPLNIRENLKELDMGDWEGKTYSEIVQTNPQFSKRFFNQECRMDPPNGETIEELALRSQEIISEILEREKENVLVVTHGAVIQVLLCLAVGISPIKYRSFDIDYGSISVLNYFQDGVQIKQLNFMMEKSSLS